ncbi:MAG: tyrosine-type recombinase/integrase [Bacteroidia bacterium]
MPTINFRLNRGKAIKNNSEPQPIYVRYRYGRGIDFDAVIKGVKVLPENWNVDKERVKKGNDKVRVNSILDSIQSHFSDFATECTNNKIKPTYNDVKNHFASFFNTSEIEENKKVNFFNFFKEFIENAKTSINSQTKKPLSSGTIRSYIVTYNVLLNFSKNHYKTDFDNINLDWYNEFVEWCKEQNYSQNYIGKHIKVVKTLMNLAVERELTTNLSFKRRGFVKLSEESENIYLNMDELNNIWQIDLKDKPQLERARDLFLIGAYTGLRVSNYNNIKKHNVVEIEGVQMIKIKSSKTGKDVAIPLHPVVKAILNKYDFNTPPRMPEQKINNYIKDVAKMARIDSDVFKSITKGGVNRTIKFKKYELVQSHTARRSFCTNAYLSGMDSIDIMSISGHKTEKVFLNYIKVEPEQRAIKISKQKFFTDNNLMKVV